MSRHTLTIIELDILIATIPLFHSDLYIWDWQCSTGRKSIGHQKEKPNTKNPLKIVNVFSCFVLQLLWADYCFIIGTKYTLWCPQKRAESWNNFIWEFKWTEVANQPRSRWSFYRWNKAMIIDYSLTSNIILIRFYNDAMNCRS